MKFTEGAIFKTGATSLARDEFGGGDGGPWLKLRTNTGKDRG